MTFDTAMPVQPDLFPVRRARTSMLAASVCAMLAASPRFRPICLRAGGTEGLPKNRLTRLEPMALGIIIAVAIRRRVLRQLSAHGQNRTSRRRISLLALGGVLQS